MSIFFCETMSVFATLLRSKGNLWIVPILVGALQLTGGIIRKGHIIVAAANLLRDSSNSEQVLSTTTTKTNLLNGLKSFAKPEMASFKRRT